MEGEGVEAHLKQCVCVCGGRGLGLEWGVVTSFFGGEFILFI